MDMEETRDDGEDDDEIHKRLKLNGLQESFRKLIKLLIILKPKILWCEENLSKE